MDRTGSGRPRAREAGVRTGQLPTGPLDAITDVAGVLVGHTTLISGEGPLVPGAGPVRTGVTAIKPHPGNLFHDKVTAAVHVINGFGKSAGFPQVEELGAIETPILLTNTLSVGQVSDALVGYMLDQNPDIGLTTVGTVNPVVGECNDGYLNDIRGRHVKAGHVRAALDAAAGGPVAEGAVGGGTGMTCYGWKGGIGTASRVVGEGGSGGGAATSPGATVSGAAGFGATVSGGPYTLGALVQANFGSRRHLTINGVAIGQALAGWDGSVAGRATPAGAGAGTGAGAGESLELGSIMTVLATDAPLTARQLKRVARRAAGGLARTGSVFGNGSGDFVIAFTTANRVPVDAGERLLRYERLPDDSQLLSGLFAAAVEAVEEAVLNALFAAGTMAGRDGHVRYGLPIDEVLNILRRHAALSEER